MNIDIGVKWTKPESKCWINLKTGCKQATDESEGWPYLKSLPKIGDVVTFVFEEGKFGFWVNMEF